VLNEYNDMDDSIPAEKLQEVQKVWTILESVADPEVPVLSVVDLGVIRKITIDNASRQSVNIDITPTYSGCPAMDMIAMQIRMALLQHGYKHIHINTVLSPAWTTDWMSEKGKEKLKAFGIAPPVGKSSTEQVQALQCPLCGSSHTHLVSQFGSTSCKALYQCNDCKEPFDYFKCH
jgi:ring-1,2-phenylacetyl-CoA epoxidase subunit PaaD